METMTTIFSNKEKPVRGTRINRLDGSPNKLCVTFECGGGYVTLHSVEAWEIRRFAAELVEGLDKLATDVTPVHEEELASV